MAVVLLGTLLVSGCGLTCWMAAVTRAAKKGQHLTVRSFIAARRHVRQHLAP